jgi:hypothetical protein
VDTRVGDARAACRSVARKLWAWSQGTGGLAAAGWGAPLWEVGGGIEPGRMTQGKVSVRSFPGFLP